MFTWIGLFKNQGVTVSDSLNSQSSDIFLLGSGLVAGTWGFLIQTQFTLEDGYLGHRELLTAFSALLMCTVLHTPRFGKQKPFV